MFILGRSVPRKTHSQPGFTIRPTGVDVGVGFYAAVAAPAAAAAGGVCLYVGKVK